MHYQMGRSYRPTSLQQNTEQIHKKIGHLLRLQR